MLARLDAHRNVLEVLAKSINDGTLKYHIYEYDLLTVLGAFEPNTAICIRLETEQRNASK